MAQLFPPSPLHTRARTLVPLSNDSKTQTTNNAKCTPGSGKDRRRAAWFSEHQTLQESRCWWQGLQTKCLTGNLKELRWGSEVMELVLGSVPPEVLLPPAASLPSTDSTPGLPESSICGVTDFLTGLNTELGCFILEMPTHAVSFSFLFYFLTCFLLPDVSLLHRPFPIYTPHMEGVSSPTLDHVLSYLFFLLHQWLRSLLL